MDSGEQKYADGKPAEVDRPPERSAIDHLLYGLTSRAHMDRAANEEIKRSIRTRIPFSLLIIGVDFSHEYRDHCEALRSEECLHAAISAIKSSLRRSGDLVSRYGNDEFVAGMPETDIIGAIKVAKTMQDTFAGQNVPYKKNTYGGATLSIGVAMLGHHLDTDRIDSLRTTLFLLADRALCIAKLAGGNRVYGLDWTSLKGVDIWRNE